MYTAAEDVTLTCIITGQDNCINTKWHVYTDTEGYIRQTDVTTGQTFSITLTNLQDNTVVSCEASTCDSCNVVYPERPFLIRVLDTTTTPSVTQTTPIGTTTTPTDATTMPTEATTMPTETTTKPMTMPTKATIKPTETNKMPTETTTTPTETTTKATCTEATTMPIQVATDKVSAIFCAPGGRALFLTIGLSTSIPALLLGLALGRCRLCRSEKQTASTIACVNPIQVNGAAVGEKEVENVREYHI